MYTYEVYASIVWNGVMRVREQQVNVSYPSEIDDELFSHRGYNGGPQSPADTRTSPNSRLGQVASTSWLCGWNFTTDLYRILEHVIANFRDQQRHHGSFPISMFGERSTAASISSVRNSITQLYSDLPYCFKDTPEVTCSPAR
jgi:hypothetical protein